MKKVLMVILLAGCAAPADAPKGVLPVATMAPVTATDQRVSPVDSAAVVSRRSEQAERWRAEAERTETLLRDTDPYIVSMMKVQAPQSANVLFEPDGEIFVLVVLDEDRTVEFEFTVTITETGQVISRQGFTTTIRGAANSDIIVNIPFGNGAFIGAGESRHLRFTARAVELDAPVRLGFLPLRIEAMLQRLEPDHDRSY